MGEGFPGRRWDAVNSCIGHYVPPEDPDPADTARRQESFNRGPDIPRNGNPHPDLRARRVAGPDPWRGGTLLDALLDSELTGSDVELRDQVLTLIMAGHETTAKALTWTLYLLDRYPEQAALVRAEVDQVLGGRTPTAADQPRLPRCRRAIQEAMRLYPPVWLISRRARAADEIDGYDVEPGTLVCISQWVLHRDPRYWSRPEEFRPERFAAPVRPSHLYLPFGGGERICIGQALRDGGGDAGARHAHPERPARTRRWLPGRAGGPGHAAAAVRHEHDRPAPVSRSGSYDPARTTAGGLAGEIARLEAQAEFSFAEELRILRESGIGGSGTLLELGAGSGAVTRRLRAAMPDARILALDIDQTLRAVRLRRGRSACRRRRGPAAAAGSACVERRRAALCPAAHC